MPFSFELMNDQIKLYVYGVNMYMRENLKKMKNLNQDVPFISFLRLEQIKDYSNINDNYQYTLSTSTNDNNYDNYINWPHLQWGFAGPIETNWHKRCK